jgi:hypothetical protein
MCSERVGEARDDVAERVFIFQRIEFRIREWERGSIMRAVNEKPFASEQCATCHSFLV